MTITGLIGMLIVAIFFGLMIIFNVVRSGSKKARLRSISAFTKLKQAIGLAVEDGAQIHLSLGRGGVTSPQSASAFLGLSMMKQVMRIASAGDSPIVATTGNPALAILAQDTINSTSKEVNLNRRGESSEGKLAGLTPFSYAVGSMSSIRDDRVSANILAGWYGSEIIWLSEASERQNSFTLAGTAHLPAQAIMYATVGEPLIGEELFAGGAYLDAGSMHEASLNAQDVFRWVLVIGILLGILLKFAGFDQIIHNLLVGIQ